MTQRNKRTVQTQEPNKETSEVPVARGPQPTRVVVPLKPGKFGMGVHEFNTFNARVPGSTPKEHLTDGRFWAHVALKIKVGSEIRVLAEDCSFRALLLVVYVRGTEVIVKLIDYTEVASVDYDALNTVVNGYKLSERGTRGWCIVKETTGEIVKEGFANQTIASRALADYLKAMVA